MDETRRAFLKQLATVTGGVVLVPLTTSCTKVTPKKTGAATKTGAASNKPAGGAEVPAVPVTQPADWDPIAFNKQRGNAGAIPESYHASINGADGDTKHLGKHLPYVPTLAGVPAGFVALMWGDPGKGYAQHPNAPKTEDNPEGHWYNWIKVRKAVEGEAEEAESAYADWPPTKELEQAGYMVAGEGKEITADGGIHTVYLAKLPGDVKQGDTLRIYAHCLTHGEYVDFLTL